MRLQIIGVVITGGEHIGPGHDAPLYFRTKSLAPCSAIQVHQVDGVFSSMSEAHAVKPRHVRRTLCRRDDIISWYGQINIRQANLHNTRALILKRCDRCPHLLLIICIEACVEMFPYNSDPQAFERPVQCSAVVRDWLWRRGRVSFIKTSHHTEQECGILSRPGDDAGLVKAGGESHHSVSRNTAIRRLNACCAG